MIKLRGTPEKEVASPKVSWANRGNARATDCPFHYRYRDIALKHNIVCAYHQFKSQDNERPYRDTDFY